MKKRGETSLENPLTDKLIKKKLIFSMVIIAIIIIIFVLGILIYNYIKTPGKEIKLGDFIDRIYISPDGKDVYIKLKSNEIENITSIKFVFSANGKEYNYDTSEPEKNISAKQNKNILDDIFSKEFQIYDYSINSKQVGLDNLNEINEVNTVIKYKTPEGTEVQTPLLNTTKPVKPTPPKSGGGGGGGSGGGSSSSGGGSPSTSCIPSKTCLDYAGQCAINLSDGCNNVLNCSNNCNINQTCINETCINNCANNNECNSSGIFCNQNMSYNCNLGNDGCLKKENITICNNNKECINGIGCIEIPECINNNDCSSLNNVCSLGICNLTSNKCQVQFNSSSNLCRASVGECDIAETCSGSSTACPSNIFKSSGTLCSSGFCNGNNSCINCFNDLNCGTDEFTGNKFCQLGDLYQNYISFSCNSPGNIFSSCSNSTISLLNQSCGTSSCGSFGNNYCIGNNVYHNQSCSSKGCDSNINNCFNNPYTNSEIVQTCTKKCLNGNCVECTDTSDCPASSESCKEAACTNNNCGFTNKQDGTSCTTNDSKPGACQSGNCVCTKQCSGKQCGDDGCGGSCGTCNDNNECTSDNCNSEICSYINLSGTPCDTGNGVCDSSGNCVENISENNPEKMLNLEFATISDSNNPPDNSSTWYPGTPALGNVSYIYRITKNEITREQYLIFLNAVDPNGTNEYLLWNQDDFNLSLSEAPGQRYFLSTPEENLPADVSWYAIARFMNWLNYWYINGVMGGPNSTEADNTHGVYDTRYFSDSDLLNDPDFHNPGSKCWIPTFNEWYKVAYWDKDAQKYWGYPNRGNTAPSGGFPGVGYGNMVDSASDGIKNPSPERKIAVGSYTTSQSIDGLYDLCGNLAEWVEEKTWGTVLFPANGYRMILGGKYTWFPDHTMSWAQATYVTHRNGPGPAHRGGFRISTSVECINDSQCSNGKLCRNNICSAQDSGWYSFEKDNHNSRIADFNMSPPFKLKYIKEIPNKNLYFHYFGNLYSSLFSKNGYLALVLNTQCYRELHNISTGESLWNYQSACSPAEISAIDEVLTNEYILGVDSHYHQSGQELESGLNLPPFVNMHASNIDPSNSIIIAQGWCGVDAPSLCLDVMDISNYTGAHPVPEGKFDKAFRFEKFFYIYTNIGFEYIDLGKREHPWNRTDLRQEFNPGKNNWTIMLWFKWDGVRWLPNLDSNWNPQILFRKGGFGAKINDGWLQYSFHNFDPFYNDFNHGNGTFYCAPNEWCQLTITYDHQQEKIYKNGVLVFNRSETRDIGENQNSLYIGNEAGNWNNGFSGWIDEFAMFNRSLSASEIASKYNGELIPDSSTVLLLHFNNDSSHGENDSIIHDYSENHNDAVSVYHHFPKKLLQMGGRRGFSSTLIPIDNGIIYRLGDGILIAQNITDGENIWQKGFSNWDTTTRNISLGERLFSTIQSIDSNGIIYSFAEEVTNVSFHSQGTFYKTKVILIGLNLTNGNEIYVNDLNYYNNQVFYSDPGDFIIENNISYLFINSYNNNNIYFPNKIEAVNLSSKRIIWAINLTEAIPISYNKERQLFVLSGNTLFLNEGNAIIAFNKLTGEKVWEFKNPYANFKRPDGIDNIWPYIITGLIIDKDQIFISTGTSKKVFAFEKGYSFPKIMNSEGKLPDGIAGNLYVIPFYYGTQKINYSFYVIDGQYPYNWQVVSGKLPDGLVLLNDSENVGGFLNGTPTESGLFNFTLRVTDALGNYDKKNFSILIYPDSRVFSMSLQNGVNNYSGCEDSYIQSLPNPNANFGNEAVLLSLGEFAKVIINYKLFKSEGGPIPDDAIIINATLTLYKNDSYRNWEFNGYKILKKWNETEVTWNNATKNQAWSIPGINGTDDISEKLFNNRLWDTQFNSGLYTFDITLLIKEYSLGGENFGWRFDSYNLEILSCQNNNISKRPKLTVNYKRFNSSNNPPYAKIYVNPSIRLKGTNFVFNGSGSYDDGNITDYFWNGCSMLINDPKICNGTYDLINHTLCWYCLNCNNPGDCSWIQNLTKIKNWCTENFTKMCPYPNATYIINLTVTDDLGVSVTNNKEIMIVDSFTSPTITTTMLRDGTVGQAYSENVYVEGISNPHRVILSGSLPPGLNLNLDTGVISGTPTQTGTFNFTIGVSGTSANRSLTISIYDSNETFLNSLNLNIQEKGLENSKGDLFSLGSISIGLVNWFRQLFRLEPISF